MRSIRQPARETASAKPYFGDGLLNTLNCAFELLDTLCALNVGSNSASNTSASNTQRGAGIAKTVQCRA